MTWQEWDEAVRLVAWQLHQDARSRGTPLPSNYWDIPLAFAELVGRKLLGPRPAPAQGVSTAPPPSARGTQ